MRKCKGQYMARVGYTNFKTVDFNLGYFHEFGNDFEEFESGAGNYTTAIVELPDGRLVEAILNSIQFLTPQTW